MLAQEWLEFVMDGCYVNFELAASCRFIWTSIMWTFVISNFVMHCFYVAYKTLSTRKRLRTLIAQKWFDLIVDKSNVFMKSPTFRGFKRTLVTFIWTIVVSNVLLKPRNVGDFMNTLDLSTIRSNHFCAISVLNRLRVESVLYAT
jgi:hypothetical protein